MAEKIGNSKAMNIVLLGSLVKALSIDDIDWKEMIAQTVPKKFVELNQEAFKAGYKD